MRKNRGGIRMLAMRASLCVRRVFPIGKGRQIVSGFRRLGVAPAAWILAAVAAHLASAPNASAAAPTVVDCSTTDLQTAIDNSDSGTTLAVSGTCSGNYTIDKDMTLRGRGDAVLDGQGRGTTLTVSPNATVQVANLTVTDGKATGTGLAGNGGGINNSGVVT